MKFNKSFRLSQQKIGEKIIDSIMIVVMTLQFKRKTIRFFINHDTIFHTFNDPGSM